jgi:UDP-glucose 4-epimerase
MQITVTGGSGFVGSHVVDALLRAGHDVRVIDQRPPLQLEADWREIDLLDEEALTGALAGSDAVFHLAAMADVNDVLAKPVESVALNALGTVRLLEAARRADTGRVILASTVWVYSATHGQVVDEETLFDLEADKHIYVSEKLAAEMFCRDYLNLYGRPYTVLRYGIPFGPRMRSDLVVAAFLERALRGEALAIDGDGSQTRQFVYVEDLAAAHVLALAPVAANRTYNLESTEATSIRQIAENVRDLVGDVTVSFGPARKGDYEARRVSSDRARVELGWEPTSTFTEGLAKTLEWYRAQGPVTVPQVEPSREPVGAVRTQRRIAIVPAYNEEPTVAAVLDELSPLVDELLVVDDGSTDGTRAAIEAWMPGHAHVRLLVHDVNQGMSEAYLLALNHLRERLERDELDRDDLVFTVDADGQHDIAVLDELARATVDGDVDAMLARRDLSYHGPVKKLGNWILSSWASAWAGRRLHDVESGYRVFRLGALAHALDYYSGRKYSETVEVAVVMSRLGYRVRNDHLVPVPVARSRTSLTDAAIDFAAIPMAASRVWRSDHAARAAPATLSIVAVLALLFAVTIGHGSWGMVEFGFAAVAAAAAGLLARKLVPNGSLPIIGAAVAAVSAWLVPQRTDLGSTVALAVLFSIGVAIASPPGRTVRRALLGVSVVVLLAFRLGDLRTALLIGAVGVVVFESGLAMIHRRGALPRLRSRRLAFGSSIVAITAMTTLYFGSTTVSATWFGGGVVHGPRNTNKVALTFDNGTNARATSAMMQVLDAQHVTATFFVVGKTADQNPQIVRALYDHGFLVGNQSYHDDHWRWMDPRYPELERAQRSVGNVLGVCPAWYRPPQGRKTPFIEATVHKHDMQMVLWDVSASDAKISNPHEIAQRVLQKVRGGSIIDLQDDLDGQTAANQTALIRAMPEIIAGLRARHLDPVRLDQLFNRAAYTTCS